MFWFQKHHPDVVGDFRNIPYDDGRFDMVVFDPPHLRWAGPNSIMKAQYGQLSETWPQDIAQGFKECMRVLKSGGFLIFKWNECQIRVNEVLKLMDTTPLFGNRRGDTHWLVFTKEGCQNEEIS